MDHDQKLGLTGFIVYPPSYPSCQNSQWPDPSPDPPRTLLVDQVQINDQVRYPERKEVDRSGVLD